MTKDWQDAISSGDPVAYVDDMPYDKANEFLTAFNNGKLSFDGRIW